MEERILVTGASGFVGKRLLQMLRMHHPDAHVTAFGGPSTSHDMTLDLSDPASCHAAVDQYQPTTIVHLAAQSSVGGAFQAPQSVWRTNFDGTRALAQAARSLTFPVHMIFSSSAEVYGASFNDGPRDEASPIAPVSPYARTKAACEMMLMDVAGPGLKVTALRLFNHTGPGQDERFVVPTFAAQIARAEAETDRAKRIVLVGNLEAARDISDVDDVLDAYLAVIRGGTPTVDYDVFNVGSGQTRPIRWILETMLEGIEGPITVTPDEARMRPSDIPTAEGVFSRFKAAFGWSPQRDIRTTLKAVLQNARQKHGKSDISKLQQFHTAPHTDVIN